MHENRFLAFAIDSFPARLDRFQQPGMDVPDPGIQYRTRIDVPVGHDVKRILIRKLVAVLRGRDSCQFVSAAGFENSNETRVQTPALLERRIAGDGRSQLRFAKGIANVLKGIVGAFIGRNRKVLVLRYQFARQIE